MDKSERDRIYDQAKLLEDLVKVASGLLEKFVPLEGSISSLKNFFNNEKFITLDFDDSALVLFTRMSGTVVETGKKQNQMVREIGENLNRLKKMHRDLKSVLVAAGDARTTSIKDC